MPVLTELPQPQQYPFRRKSSAGPQTTLTANSWRQYTSPMSHQHLILTVVGSFYLQSEDDPSQRHLVDFISPSLLSPFKLFIFLLLLLLFFSSYHSLSTLPPPPLSLLSHLSTNYVCNLATHHVRLFTLTPHTQLHSLFLSATSVL